jgi:hypothetical protein
MKLKQTIAISNHSKAFDGMAASVAACIKDNADLYAAFLAFCKDKGHNPETYLSDYATYCIENSADNTSSEDADGSAAVVLYGDFSAARGIFAARVNLLGLPEVKKQLLYAISHNLKVRTHFYVEEGRINGAVELVGTHDIVMANTRKVRDTLRTFNFGDIETLDGEAIEEGGNISVATLASRTLP